MLLQMHWQFKDDTTEMRAQRDCKTHEEHIQFATETNEQHPLPEGARWLFVKEESPLFVKTVAKEDA